MNPREKASLINEKASVAETNFKKRNHVKKNFHSDFSFLYIV